MTDVHLPKTALIVKRQWAEALLSGTKSWEIRGVSTSKRTRIALAVSGTGQLWGEVTIRDAKLVGYRLPNGRLVPGNVSSADFISNNFERHRISNLDLVQYPKIWAWVMTDPKKYDPPKSYVHHPGCVIWNPLDKPPKSKPKATAVKKRPSRK